MEDIDSYLSGKMEGEERTAFEANLKNNPELEAELLVRRGLRQLMLEKKVAAVAEARNKTTRINPWPYLLAACVVLLVASLSVFFIVKNEKTPLTHDLPALPVVPTPSPEEKELLASDTADSKVQKHKELIAENKPSTLLPPLYPAPNVRGQGSENEAWTQLLDKVWYTDYPPTGLILEDKWTETHQLLVSRDFTKAYVRLQKLEKTLAENDTLRYLKGYCLIELGEGAEALTYYQGLEQRHPEWADQLEWYRGLGTLLAGERAKALVLFKEIAGQSKHPYRKESERAVQLLLK